MAAAVTDFRLPGVYFLPAPRPNPVALPPLDVTGLVGFATRGPLNTPVPVEDLATFDAVFGGPFALARDGSGKPVYAYLRDAVATFFSSGGRRTYAVRVAGENATAARFAVPGLIAFDAFGDPSAAGIDASSPGIWGNTLRLAAELEATPAAADRLLDPRRDRPALDDHRRARRGTGRRCPAHCLQRRQRLHSFRWRARRRRESADTAEAIVTANQVWSLRPDLEQQISPTRLRRSVASPDRRPDAARRECHARAARQRHRAVAERPGIADRQYRRPPDSRPRRRVASGAVRRGRAVRSGDGPAHPARSSPSRRPRCSCCATRAAIRRVCRRPRRRSCGSTGCSLLLAVKYSDASGARGNRLARLQRRTCAASGATSRSASRGCWPAAPAALPTRPSSSRPTCSNRRTRPVSTAGCSDRRAPTSTGPMRG